MQTAYPISHLLKLGDLVTTWVGTKPGERDIRRLSSFWSQIPPDGTKGRIVSFQRRSIVSAPGNDEFGTLGLGVFSYDNVPIVLFDGQEMPIMVSAGYLALQDQAGFKVRLDTFHQDRLVIGYKASRKNDFLARNIVRMSDLPDDMLMMGDVVAAPADFGGVTHAVVRSATLRECEADFGSAPPVHAFSYDVQLYDGEDTAGSTRLRHEEVKLDRRGKEWEHYVQGSTTFVDLHEKARFLFSTMQFEEIRNPVTGMFRWTEKDVREGMRSGVVDYVRDGFGSTSDSAYRFDDAEFGRLYRESMIAQNA